MNDCSSITSRNSRKKYKDFLNTRKFFPGVYILVRESESEQDAVERDKEGALGITKTVVGSKVKEEAEAHTLAFFKGRDAKVSSDIKVASDIKVSSDIRGEVLIVLDF